MPTQASLKDRIASVEKTQKITHAMRLVAMSLYNRAEHAKINIASFLETTELLKNLIIPPATKALKDIFLRTNNDQTILNKDLIIIIASDKGLCGSFHESLRRFFKHRNKKNTQKPVDMVYIGSKAKLIQGQIFESVDQIEQFEGITLTNLQTLSHEIMNHIYEKNYRNVRCFSNRFINFFSYRPTETVIYPIALDEKNVMCDVLSPLGNTSIPETGESFIPSQDDAESNEYEFEQSYDDFIKVTVRLLGIARCSNILIQSLLAEQSSRFLAMNGATKNADAALERMRLQHHKLRQTGITREISELSRAL